ncbi:PRC-barrel domain-containing protein [Aquabacter spiritensis]|uniref:PRC-barrel domain protein n=1 Tax=Aquabacter spiritensis TaxID=933073 RepID=A0A4R3LMM7_9HYPH|nr:PRC-barrel domain-containing protein [Aquabacter spiritensis]TCT01564.1 PRC-barrel domain protein [Aquabacter spiritensis]
MQTKHVLGATVATLGLAIGSHGAMAQQQTTQPGMQRPATAQQQMPAQQNRQPGMRGATQGEQGQRQQVAQQCLQNLQAFDRRLDQDGYWLAGWGTPGYGTDANRNADNRGGDRRAAETRATDPRAEANRGADDRATTQPTRGGTTAQTATPNTNQMWAGDGWGIRSAPYQIRTLRAAVNVLAHRGDEQACATVLDELRQVYNGYSNELKQAGVNANEVSNWRQQRLVGARPVSEVQTGLINLANVTATEVRNPKDEQLGTVEDIVLDPGNGDIRYLIVASGGILGLGEDMVAVPWSSVRATSGLNTFVLNVSEDVIDQAPTVDPDRFSDPNQSTQDRQRVDTFWREHAG